MSGTEEYNIEFLDLNRHRFKYGFLGGHDETQRSIRIYIAFRAMLLIDQLHDFLQQGEDRNKLFIAVSKSKKDDSQDEKDEKKESKNTNKERQQNLYHNMVVSMFKGIDEFMTKVLDKNTKMIDMEKQGKKEDIVYSQFFMEEINFFRLFLNYFSVDKNYIPAEKPSILVSENKYKIVDEILYNILGNKAINIEDLYIKNNVVYDCTNNFSFIEGLTTLNYNKRYSPDAARTVKMSITVDADKSKYGTSEIAKQGCASNRYIEYIKTNGTLFDSASATSTTETILDLIKSGTKKIKSKYDGLKQNIKNNKRKK